MAYVAPPSNTGGILGRRALSARRLARLGATPDFHHGLLDPQVGFLHRDRPGRPSLALDLMEELRPFLADRLTLSLINRRQIQVKDFATQESGAVLLTDAGRKKVLVAYQKRKDDVVTHPYLGEKTTLGLLPHLQALLFARYLRGDLDGYPAFVAK